MADRMRRVWAPIDVGVLAVSSGVTGYFRPLSILEAELDRKVRLFTVTRVICKIWVTPQVNNNPVYMMHGLRIDNENSTGITPGANETADWILHGSIWASGTAAAWKESDATLIDNRSQRKSQGEESELRWYYENLGNSNDLYVGFQGRALLLLP